MENYKCGECGETSFIIEGTYDDWEGWTPIWIIKCLHGHIWVPVPGTKVIVRTLNENDDED